MQTYVADKEERDRIESAIRDASQAIRAFPTNAIGLTPDDVKASPEYIAAKAKYNALFSRLRAFNTTHTRKWKHEIAQDRKAKADQLRAGRNPAKNLETPLDTA